MENKQITLNKIIQIGFIVILVLIVSNGASAFFIMNKMSGTASWVAHAHNVIEVLNQRLNLIMDAETGQRGYLYTGDAVFLEPYKSALEHIDENHAVLLELVKDNPAQTQRLESAEKSIKQKLNWMAETVALRQSGKAEEAATRVSLGKGKALMDNIRIEMSEMIRAEKALLVQRQIEAKSIQNVSQSLIIGGTFLAIITCLSILVFINRNIIRRFMIPVNDTVALLTSSTNEILATIAQHERTASQQIAAASQTSATIEELSVSSRRSAEQAATAAAAAERASAATVQGGNATHQAVLAMSSLKDKIAVMADQILHLGEQTGQIGNIATLVKDLSGQINMLALNAAVEAARAGEHGKGFAVVASEVRKLADQSKKSAEQATTVVADIQKATNSSIMMTEESSRIATEVTQLAQNVAELFSNLSGMASSVNENAQQVMLNAKQQSAAFVQVVEATNSISSGARETAAGISQTKIGVQKLNEAAENLKAIM